MARLNKSVYRMLLDLYEGVSKYEIHVKQGDAYTRRIVASLCSGGEPYEISDMANVAFYANGSERGGATISNNEIILDIPTGMMEHVGEFECEFELSATEGAKVLTLTTSSFRIVVDETA